MSLKTSTTAATLSLALLLLPPASMAVAQEMKGMDHSSKHTDSASTKAFEDANAKMHKTMTIPYSGNADADFVRSMIPHHQGAIDMAKVELAHGKDPQLRKLAEEIIKAQEAEIANMQAWLKAHGQ